MSVFHEFYSHIEYVHRSNESIFAVSGPDDEKPGLDSNGDTLDIPPEDNSSSNKPQGGSEREGGSDADESVKLEDFDPE